MYKAGGLPSLQMYFVSHSWCSNKFCVGCQNLKVNKLFLKLLIKLLWTTRKSSTLGPLILWPKWMSSFLTQQTARHLPDEPASLTGPQPVTLEMCGLRVHSCIATWFSEMLTYQIQKEMRTKPWKWSQLKHLLRISLASCTLKIFPFTPVDLQCFSG